MNKISFRPRAWIDIQNSAEYLASEASIETAERFLDAIVDLTQRLANLPQMGTHYHFHHPLLRDVRRLPVTGFGKWLLFYQGSEGAIEVIRVLHGARDIASILNPHAPRL
jgi:toxin ParE1/3/4